MLKRYLIAFASGTLLFAAGCAHHPPRTMVFAYADFGPQAAAYKHIGYDWYQWQAHGNSRPSSQDDVRVVVYDGLSLKQVKQQFPVSEIHHEDYRYLSLAQAFKYIDANAKELPSLLTTRERLTSYFGQGCLSPQPPGKTKTVRGVLRHYPDSVKSVQAWYGHNFMVDETPILPSATVPEETLRQHVDRTVIITGTWNPGRCWTPSAEEKNAQMPVFPENEIVIVGDGLKASSIRPVNQ